MMYAGFILENVEHTVPLDDRISMKNAFKTSQNAEELIIGQLACWLLYYRA